MSRQCAVCGHPERQAIDRAILAGEPKSFSKVGIVLPQHQLAFEPMRLGLMVTVFMFICGGHRFRQSA